MQPHEFVSSLSVMNEKQTIEQMRKGRLALQRLFKLNIIGFNQIEDIEADTDRQKDCTEMKNQIVEISIVCSISIPFCLLCVCSILYFETI